MFLSQLIVIFNRWYMGIKKKKEGRGDFSVSGNTKKEWHTRLLHQRGLRLTVGPLRFTSTSTATTKAHYYTRDEGCGYSSHDHCGSWSISLGKE